ncbi:MAG: (d)CMP kinase [Arenicellales bacterium]|nr:(d)CMP kinase [Arenicellales bacterium]
MTSLNVPVLTLDGPSGSGKGTVGQFCAQRLGWHYLDSGALYRALAYTVDRSGIDIDDLEAVLCVAKKMQFECRPSPPEPAEIVVNGDNVGNEVRNEGVGETASLLAQKPEVRAVLLDLQREARRPPGLVADGRDMGTVVFPEADLKIFLTASVEERAQRRYNQLKLKGFNGSLADLFQAIQERDARDVERTTSPLVAAEDAVTIDSTNLTIDEVVTRVLDLVLNQLDIAGIDTTERETGLT